MGISNTDSLKEFKHFAYRIFIFLITVVVLDQLCGNLLRVLYFKQKHNSAFETTYAMEKVKSQVLIIGSSRAKHHYDPKIFEDSLKLSCYNAGRDAEKLFYYDAILKSALKRYHPQIVILDILGDELRTDSYNYNQITSLLPYYTNHPEIRKIVLLKSPNERLKLLSAIYPFNSLIIPILANTFGGNDKKPETQKNGFSGDMNGTVHKHLEKTTYDNTIDTTIINTLRSFITDCKEKNVKLYIIVSPCFKRYTNQSRSTLITRQIADRYQVKLWDYSQDIFFISHPQFFNDEIHLNIKGAEIYSKLIASRIATDLRAKN